MNADRTKGIGGSEIGGILGFGLNKAVDIFASKIGLGERVVGIEADVGKEAEPMIARIYEKRTGAKLIKPEPWRQHPTVPYFYGSADGLYETMTKGVEIKFVGYSQQWKWGYPPDGYPDEVACQCTWYMPIYGVFTFDIAALIGTELRIYTIEYDESLYGALAEAGHTFWNEHVLTRIPPTFEASPAVERYLKSKYPYDKNPTLLQATKEQIALVQQYREAKARADETDKEKVTLENQIKDITGESFLL